MRKFRKKPKKKKIPQGIKKAKGDELLLLILIVFCLWPIAVWYYLMCDWNKEITVNIKNNSKIDPLKEAFINGVLTVEEYQQKLKERTNESIKENNQIEEIVEEYEEYEEFEEKEEDLRLDPIHNYVDYMKAKNKSKREENKIDTIYHDE